MKLWTVEVAEQKSVTIYVLADSEYEARAVGHRCSRHVLREVDHMEVEVAAIAERDQQALAKRLTVEDYVWVSDGTGAGGHWADPAEVDRLLGEAATKLLTLDERPVFTPGQEKLP